jgi:hypothetical protein
MLWSHTLEVVIACLLIVYGLYSGISKRNLTISLGKSSRTAIPFTLKGVWAVLSGFMFMVSGVLLILYVGLELPIVVGSVGCWLPILVFVFSFLLQSFINLGRRFRGRK